MNAPIGNHPVHRVPTRRCLAKRQFIGSCAAAAAFLTAGVCNADSSFETGAAWGVSRNNGGSYISPPGTTSTRTLPDGDQVTGIWEGNPSNLADTWYRLIFNVTEPTLNANLQFRTDDLFELLVNGNSVPGVADDPAGTKDSSPVPGLSIPANFFQIGSNEILFKTQVAGDFDPFLAARLDLSTSIPEPASALVAGLGAAVLFCRRRRADPTLG
jgi:hypothetical protein